MMKMKKIYTTPAVKFFAAQAASCYAVSTGTGDVFVNDSNFEEEDEEELKLPKPKDIWED